MNVDPSMADGNPIPRLEAKPDAAVATGALPRDAMLELARAASSGDVRATRQLLELVAPRVVRAVRAVMGPAHPELDDATQLALIGFIQALPSFRGDCQPVQFAARIAVRTAGTTRRRATLRGSRHDPSADLDTLQAPPGELDAARRRDAVRRLLDDLPEEQAEALALRMILGWSIKEIAAATETPINTVRSRLRLAKEGLRRRVAEDPALAEALDEATGEP
jgi:RNA polymerase sigma factor (sigma-70 family)